MSVERQLVTIVDSPYDAYRHLIGTQAIRYISRGPLAGLMRLPLPDRRLGGTRYIQARYVSWQPVRVPSADGARQVADDD